jgi:hypothetical protein
MAESYIPTKEYNTAVIIFATALGLDTDQLQLTIGGEFDVWPESIRPAVADTRNPS